MKWMLFILSFAFLSPAFAQYSYDGEFKLELMGTEYRNAKSYPMDVNNKKSAKENAKQSIRDLCQQKETELRDLLTSSINQIQCNINQYNVAKDSQRRRAYQYQATLTVQSSLPVIKTITESKIDGQPAIATNFDKGDGFKWQHSREAARTSYKAACEQYKINMQKRYADELIFASCGPTQETGIKAGWHYVSQGQVFLQIPMDKVPSCKNGKKEGQTWWQVQGTTSTPVDCKWGGDRTRVYEKQVELTCSQQQIIRTRAYSKKGNYIGMEGQCQATPSDCVDRNGNTRVHNSIWSRRMAPSQEAAACKWGGHRIYDVRRKQRMQCWNGQVSKKGTPIEIDRVENPAKSYTCKPLPSDCLNRRGEIIPHGQAYWVPYGVKDKKVACKRGGYKKLQYKLRALRRCYNGQPDKQNLPIKTKIAKRAKPLVISRCPKPCGKYNHGQEFWANTSVSKRKVSCGKNGTRTAVYANQEMKICNDGRHITKRKYGLFGKRKKRGNVLLRYEGKCNIKKPKPKPPKKPVVKKPAKKPPVKKPVVKKPKPKIPKKPGKKKDKKKNGKGKKKKKQNP